MKKIVKPSLVCVAAVAVLAGCATVPTGPSQMVLPGAGKNFDQFRGDDAECRQYAAYQVSASPTGGSVDPAVRNAAIGTAVGAAAGAVMGGHQGAGIGAGAGLLLGTATGASAAQNSNYQSQRNYDNAYVQCMYAKGHQVPVHGSMMRTAPATQPAPAAPAAPAAAMTPPPPPPPSR